MSILSKSFTINFTQVPNFIINDKDVSLAGKGLYLYFISKPDGWEFSLNGIVTQLKESRPTVIKIIDELHKNGYLKKIKNRKNGKQDTNNYILFDKPNLSATGSESKSLTQKLRVRNSDSEFLTTSNTIASNTIASNTIASNTLSTKSVKTDKRESFDFKKFKDYVSSFNNFNFDLKQKLDYSKNHKGFCIKNSYIFSYQIQKLIEADEAFKIWDYLYKNKSKVFDAIDVFIIQNTKEEIKNAS